jgi:DNA-binding MarR family transcriptional regulator
MANKKQARMLSVDQQASELPEECPWLELGDDAELLQIQDFPTFLLMRLAVATRNSITLRYLKPHGVTLPEWRLLALVARYDTLQFGEVTAGSSMDKGQVSRTLQAIHGKGLVQLNTAAQAERRSPLSPRVEVSITPGGLELFERILPVARRAQLGLINMMSPEERVVIHNVMCRMLRQLPDLKENEED